MKSRKWTSVSYFTSGRSSSNYGDVKWACADLFPEDPNRSGANIYTRSYNIVTTSSWRRIDDDARMLHRTDKPFIHASNSKYTTRDACSLQKSGVNFHLFLALRHASHITTESVKWRNYSRFNRQKKVYQHSWIFQTNSMTIRFRNKRPSTVAKWKIYYVD